MDPERRCAPRYPIAVGILVNGGNGTTANLSDNGVYFTTSEPFSTDETVSIVFPFDLTAPGIRAVCSARVRRVDSLTAGYGVAAAHEDISFDLP